ncbi:MAG: ABC transporter ATP-binding protein [Clostridia bacterium]|nr:ABC transporter ATP-binding protein [Clostridia bacterium]
MTLSNEMNVQKDIVLTSVTKRYGEETVLDRLSLTIRGDGITALMGESGRGKSTLCALVAGLLSPDEGEIRNPYERISCAFQDPRLLPWCSALDNVAFPLSGMPRKEKRAAALAMLTSLGLKDAAEKRPHELSGGMQQRVSLARAFLSPHDLLILDEPFRGLDEANKQNVIELIRRETVPVLLVTHDPANAEALGATVVTL